MASKYVTRDVDLWTTLSSILLFTLGGTSLTSEAPRYASRKKLPYSPYRGRHYEEHKEHG